MKNFNVDTNNITSNQKVYNSVKTLPLKNAYITVKDYKKTS